MKIPRCEGWRRYGGAFTFGPVRWVRCENKATVWVQVRQEDGEKAFPACETCFAEARHTDGIKVIGAHSIKKVSRAEVMLAACKLVGHRIVKGRCTRCAKRSRKKLSKSKRQK